MNTLLRNKISKDLTSFIIIIFIIMIPHTLLAQTAGSIDESFGVAGTVVTQFGIGYEHSAGLIVQPDQKIVIAGSARIDDDYKATLVRFNTDGTYDNSFGNAGIAYSSEFGNYSNQSRPLAIQPDGKLIHVCVTGVYGEYNFLVSRFKTDGTLDTDFNGSGTVEKSVFSGDDYANSVALQPDGKIIVVGMGNTASNFFSMVAIRLDADGSMDSSFNGNGIFTTYMGDADSYIFDVTVQPNGKILLLCQQYVSGTTTTDPVLIRLNADGSYDSSFGDNGIAKFIISNGNDYVTQFALQPDGKVLVVGNTAAGNYYDVFILRVDDTSAPDNTFGTAGIVISHVSDNKNWAESIILADDGNILVGGYYTNETTLDNDGMILRFTPDGFPDPTFGDNGVATIDAYDYRIENIELQADQKIVVSGWYYSGSVNSYEFAVSRLLSEDNVGVEDFSVSHSEYAIFPNPSNGKFSIKLTEMKMREAELAIFDQAGRKVFK
jgi:uncharacterized delta-60 repeat protein